MASVVNCSNDLREICYIWKNSSKCWEQISDFATKVQQGQIMVFCKYNTYQVFTAFSPIKRDLKT